MLASNVRYAPRIFIKCIPRGTLAMGFPKGRSAALPFGQGRGSYPVINITGPMLSREMADMHIDMSYFTIFLRPWH
jgi:hypothetical protein